MASKYRLQIVEADTGKIVHGWAPGLAAEVEFVNNLTARVKAKGVGFLRSADHVTTAVRTAAEELLLDLKRTI